MATDPRVKNMITDQLVTYEVARLAKKKGFDGECRDFYCNDKVQKRISVTSCNRQVTSFDYCSNAMLEDYDSPKEYYHYAAPTQSLLQRWLREEKMVHIEIAHNPMYGGFIPYLCKIENSKYGVFTLLEANCHCIAMHNATYEEALEAGLQYALKYPDKWNTKEK